MLSLMKKNIPTGSSRFRILEHIQFAACLKHSTEEDSFISNKSAKTVKI